jgi:hypothetical protein
MQRQDRSPWRALKISLARQRLEPFGFRREHSPPPVAAYSAALSRLEIAIFAWPCSYLIFRIEEAEQRPLILLVPATAAGKQSCWPGTKCGSSSYLRRLAIAQELRARTNVCLSRH